MIRQIKGLVLLASIWIGLAVGTPALLASASIPPPVEYAQLTVERRVIIRIPSLLARRKPVAPPVEYHEKRGPKCVAVRGIRAAAMGDEDALDLLLADNSRLRAQLDDCAAIDFYSGFYMEPNADGQLCAGRDTLHARSGAMCVIEKFHRLVPEE